MRNLASDMLYAGARSAAAAGSSYLLDGITADWATSIARKLYDTAYDAATVRRSSDSAETDIGWDGSNEFDQSAFDTHIGGGQGYCSSLFEQINGYEWAQGTTGKQPEIVDSPLVSGKKALEFSADALHYDHGSTFFSRNQYDWFFVVRKTSTTFTEMIATWHVNASTSGVNNHALYLTSSILRDRLNATNGQVACGAPQNQNALVHIRRTGSSANFEYTIWHSGVEYTGSTAMTSLSDMDHFILGSLEGDGGSGGFTGQIVECVGRNAANFSAGEVTTIRDGLASYNNVTMP